jgi:hypothetical protein
MNYTTGGSSFRAAGLFSYLYPRYNFKPILTGGAYGGYIDFTDIERDGKTIENSDLLENIFVYGYSVGVGGQFKNVLRFTAMYQGNVAKRNIESYEQRGIDLSLIFFIKR